MGSSFASWGIFLGPVCWYVPFTSSDIFTRTCLPAVCGSATTETGINNTTNTKHIHTPFLMAFPLWCKWTWLKWEHSQAHLIIFIFLRAYSTYASLSREIDATVWYSLKKEFIHISCHYMECGLVQDNCWLSSTFQGL